MEKDLTEGNITKQIMLFALPILIGNTLQRTYTLADTIMVGRLLGTSQLAAVGAASVIANLFADCSISFSRGFSIIISQFFGAKDQKNMKKSLASTYFLSFIIGLTLTVVGLLLINPLLRVTNAPEEIFGDAQLYLRIMIGGLFTTILYHTLANILRCLGDSVVPLIFLIVSVTLNIALDYICIGVLHLGVGGAAIATIISQLVAGFACLMFCLFKRKVLYVKKDDFVDNKEINAALLPQGFSMCLMFSLVSLSTMILQRGINSLGTDYIAGYMSGRKYLELLMMPGAAIAMTSAPFVGQNYGAKKIDRIKTGILRLCEIGWVWDLIAIIITFAFGQAMVTSVTGKTAPVEIINSGILYLRIGVCTMAPLTVLVVTRSALQGMNHKKTPVISSFIELAVKILAVFVLVPKLGFFGICITEPIIWLLSAIWVLAVYMVLIKKIDLE